jgi:hypothetical protein
MGAEVQKIFSESTIKFLKNLITFADSNGKFSIIGGVYISPNFAALG